MNVKKVLGTITSLVIAVVVHAQVTVSGIVTDKNKTPLQGASVVLTILDKNKSATTDANGKFVFAHILGLSLFSFSIEL